MKVSEVFLFELEKLRLPRDTGAEWDAVSSSFYRFELAGTLLLEELNFVELGIDELKLF